MGLRDTYRLGSLTAVLAGMLACPAAGAGVGQEVISIQPATRYFGRVDDLEELWRIGASSSEWDAFSSIETVAFAEDGRIVILDRSAQRLIVADEHGNYLRDVGSRGPGPGEFRHAYDVAINPEGQIWVYDAVGRVFHKYSMSGIFERSVRQTRRRPGDHRVIKASGTGDEIVMMRESTDARVIVRVDLNEDTASDRVAYSTWRPDKRHADGVVFAMRGLESNNGPAEVFFPQLHFDPLPDGRLAVADSSSYRVKIVGRDGGVSRIISAALSPMSTTLSIRRAERARLQAEMVERWTSPVLRKAWSDAVRNVRFFPEVPVVTALRTGWQGKLWIERRTGVYERGAIDILDLTGTYEATLETARNGQMPRAFGPQGMVAFVETDELGRSLVVVRRLPERLR